MPPINKRVSHMNNKKLMTHAFLAAVIFGQTAFAQSAVNTPDVSESLLNDITAELSLEITKELSKEQVASSAQDYQTGDFERAQPRRSALFLHILDSVVKGSTLAKAESATPTIHNNQLSDLFKVDGTLL